MLATVTLDQARYQEAREQFEAIFSASASVPGYDLTNNLADRHNLARARYALAEFALTVAVLSESVPAYDRRQGAGHDPTLKARALWAQGLTEQGEHAQEIALQRANLAHAQARETLGEDVLSLQRLTQAKLLRAGGRYVEGLPLARQGQVFLMPNRANPLGCASALAGLSTPLRSAAPR